MMASDELVTYRQMLPVNKHRLDDELEVQPSVMGMIAERVVRANSRMIQAKDDLGRVEGRLTMDLKDDDPKLTVAAVDGKVRRHDERVRAWQDYQLARSEHEEWSFMLDAWRERGFTLKTLAALYAAQYFSSDSVTVRDRPDDLRRKEMREASVRASSRRAVSESAGAGRRRSAEE